MECQPTLIRRKLGQTGPPLTVQLIDDEGLPVDLTGASNISFLMRPETGAAGVFVVDSPATVLPPGEAGRLRYTWAAGDLATVGRHLAWFRLTLPPDGEVVYAPHDQPDAGIEAAIDIIVEPL